MGRALWPLSSVEISATVEAPTNETQCLTFLAGHSAGPLDAGESWGRRGRVGLSVALIIPALDEEGAIGRVVEGFRAVVDREGVPLLDEVVVVDNGSRDGTADVARAAGATVVHEPERGYGRACLAGLAHLAARSGGPPDAVVFADGDGANVPTELPLLLEPLRSTPAHMVIGSRIRKGDADGFTLPQRFGNQLASRLLRLLYGTQTTDLGPFRAVRWSTLGALDMSDPTYGWTVEMQVKAAKQKVPTVEVDVSNKRRIAGQSKVSGTVRGVVGAGYKILHTIWVHR